MIGRRHRLAAGPLLLLAAGLTLPQPASAQVSSFLDGLFGRKEQPAPAPEPEPAPEAAPGGGEETRRPGDEAGQIPCREARHRQGRGSAQGRCQS